MYDRLTMLRARDVKNRVIDANQEVVGLPFELASERTFVEVFDYIVANESPELTRRDPHTAVETDYFCGMSTGHTGTSKLP
jgi:hypothetical protein